MASPVRGEKKACRPFSPLLHQVDRPLFQVQIGQADPHQAPDARCAVRQQEQHGPVAPFVDRVALDGL